MRPSIDLPLDYPTQLRDCPALYCRGQREHEIPRIRSRAKLKDIKDERKSVNGPH